MTTAGQSFFTMKRPIPVLFEDRIFVESVGHQGDGRYGLWSQGRFGSRGNEMITFF